MYIWIAKYIKQCVKQQKVGRNIVCNVLCDYSNKQTIENASDNAIKDSIFYAN